MTKYKHITLINHIYLSNINNKLNLCIDLKVLTGIPRKEETYSMHVHYRMHYRRVRPLF